MQKKSLAFVVILYYIFGMVQHVKQHGDFSPRRAEIAFTALAASLSILGGNVNNGANCGLLYLNANNAPSNANWNHAVRD